MEPLYLSQKILKENKMENDAGKSQNKIIAFIALQILIVILAMAVGFLGSRFYQKYQGEFSLLQQAKMLLEDNIYFELPEQITLEHGMIRGMLGAVDDPYTYFVEPASHEIQSNELAGNFGGIGARLERDTQMGWRIYPLPNSPALEAGLQDGDQLLTVDDLSVTAEMDDVTLLAALRGPVGETVKITISRDGETLSFTIERQSIPLPSVTYNLLPEEKRIGLVQINRIAETTASEIDEGLKILQEQGAVAAILDLRDNGGGLVEAGIEIARLFLTEGEIIHRQFKDKDIEIFDVKVPGPYPKIPLVLFVNGNTASAAEIIAGTLENQGRAALVGTPTFGKTTIQYVFDLEDGSSVHITSGRWWITGVSFPLAPNYPVGEPFEESQYLQTAIDILTEEIE